jgi:membrane-bound lytic murein transglycosylase D
MEKHILKHLFLSLSVLSILTLSACQSFNSSGIDLSTNAPQNTAQIIKATPSATGASKPTGKNAALQPLAQSDLSTAGVTHLSLPNNLWERIRRGFAMPELEGDLVQDRVQWYSTKPDYIERMTSRSSKYLYYIVEELEARKMPTELALLPFVESAFNPQALSSARASGIWQFMPKTGKNFDLKQSVFRDDRKDVMASTKAALDYLQLLYTKFGDWHLALAAYNWGEGNVSKAIAKNQHLGLGTTYMDLNMPMETRMYVPKLQAVKNIIATPEAFHLTLSEIPNHPYFQTVPLRRDIDVTLAAKLAEVPIEDFKALNPSASRPVLLAAGTTQILLPWDNAEIFQKNFETYSGPRMASWTAWIAPKTLSLSQAAKAIGMSESELKEINNIPQKMLIKAGSALLVPRTSKKDQDVATQVAEQGQLEFSPEQPPGKKLKVKVGKKDTLATLAKKYHVSESQILSWNGLNAKSTLSVGENITLFVSVKVTHNKKKSNTKSPKA